MKPAFLISAGILLCGADVLHSHMLNMYDADRVFEIRLGDGFLDLRALYSYKEFPSLNERLAMDRDADDVISEAEAAEYARGYQERILGEVRLDLDGRRLSLKPVKEPQLDLYGSNRIVPQHSDVTLELSTGMKITEVKPLAVDFRGWGEEIWPHPGKIVFALVASRDFAVTSTSLADSAAKFEAADLERVSFSFRKRSRAEVDSAVAAGEAIWRIAKFAQAYGFPTLTSSSTVPPAAGQGQLPQTGTAEQNPSLEEKGDRTLRTLVLKYLEDDSGKADLWLILLAAFIYGAIHALAPGHAKTLTAAYLVGSRHSWPHAVVLAGVVTATHTGSILLLAIITKLVWGGGLSIQAQAVLGAVSGLIVLVLGIQRLTGRASFQPHSHDHDHYDQNHDHDHDHNHGHTHQHHDVPPQAGGGMQSVIWLGFAGGLAPCPGAIWVYFLALGFGRPGLGVALIVIMSLGLSLVLTAVGLATIYFRRLLGKSEGKGEGEFAAWLPEPLRLVGGKVAAALPIVAGTALVLIGSFLIWSGLASLGLV
ncbi:MAG TPA: hypothetical protein VJ417_04090 [Candidatus Glassbacteria bacterium]|nr:hypothetical protein [Candidatus Glassbacteria bacterium]